MIFQVQFSLLLRQDQTATRTFRIGMSCLSHLYCQPSFPIIFHITISCMAVYQQPNQTQKIIFRGTGSQQERE
jgi:hypothetical protein